MVARATTPLRILIGCDTFAPDVNGAARFAERLAAGLLDRGHDVQVVAPAVDRATGRRVERHAGRDMVVHRLYSWRYRPHPWVRFAVPWELGRASERILDEVRPDVVHFQSQLNIGRVLAKHAGERGIRVVGTNHTMPDNLMQFVPLPAPVVRLVERWVWRVTELAFLRADVVTTPTPNAARYLEERTSVRGVLAVSCGLDVASYAPVLGLRPEHRILFVGRVEEEKRIDVLLRALARLPRVLGASLEIIGDGELRERLARLAAELGVADRVLFSGLVSDERLRAAFATATVFAIPSTAELQSIATMEAMASGLPVVAANAMALPHLVHDGENGYLVPPGDDEALAAALARVLEASPEEYERLQRASLALVAGHDIAHTITAFERIYRGEPIVDPLPGASAHSTAAG